MACSDRTRGNSFKLKEGRVILDEEDIFHNQDGETLEEVTQRSCSSLEVLKVWLDGASSLCAVGLIFKVI